MSERNQRILAPVLILILILILWEGLVTALRIEQFLLPKPSAILSNLVRVVVIDAASDAQLSDSEATARLRAGQLLVRVPASLSPALLEPVEAARIVAFAQGATGCW